jgi:hypothetical protein
MLETVQCDALFVIVEEDQDWHVAVRLASTGHGPVAIVTRFLAPDRRYRNAAFTAGAAAYLSLPCTMDQMREAIARLRRGDVAIELVRDSYHQGKTSGTRCKRRQSAPP